MFGLVSVIKFIQNHREFDKSLILWTLGGVVQCWLFFNLQNSRLKLKKIPKNLDNDKLKDIIQRTVHTQEWETYLNKENYFVAKTHPTPLSGSWGEQITIIWDNHNIYINSICDPDKRSSIVSMGRNKKHIKSFITQLNKASS